MSSDSEYSEDDRKKKTKSKKVVSDDSDDDRKGKRRGRGTVSKSIIESDSDSSSHDDEDAKPSSSSRKRKAPANKGYSKKRGRGRGSSDDEIRIPGADGLELTEEERIQLQAMSEKDREAEIFKRMEELEARKIRETIERRLRQKNGEVEDDSKEDKNRGRKKDKRVVHSDNSDDSDDSERSSKPPSPVKPSKKSDHHHHIDNRSESDDDVRVNPSELHKKKKQKSAMEDLMLKRKEKEAKKASLAVDAVFGKERSSSDSSSSSASSRSSSPSSRSSSPSRSRSASPNKEDAAKKRLVDNREELLIARLSRFKLAKLVHAPFFNKTVIDCYVRIGVGQLPGRPSHNNYRIAQIVDVVETAKVYNVENARTNKGLKLRMGSDERVYRLEFVSNTEFTLNEFNEWMSSMKANNCQLPNMGDLEKKRRDIANAMNHSYTNAEVDQMLKEKGRFKEAPKNYAMTKGELMKKLEYAKQNGLHTEVARIQTEIDEVDSKADQLDKKRAGDVTAIDWINKRNRLLMKEQFLGQKKIEEFGSKEDDPFTRKSGKMRVVSGSAKNLAALDDPTAGGLRSSSSAKDLLSTPIQSSTPRLTTPSSSSTKSSDLFSLHAMKFDLDLDIDTMKNPVSDETSSRVLHNVSSSSSRGRPLSLEDYKKRKMDKVEQ